MNDKQPKTPGAMVLVSRDTANCSFHSVAHSLKTLANGPAIERHRSAMSELASALDSQSEQPPAVGGEPELFALKYYNDCGGYSPEMVPVKSLPDPEGRETFYRVVDVAPLAAEIERLTSLCIRKDQRAAAMNESWSVCIQQRDNHIIRIAELEAQLTNKNN